MTDLFDDLLDVHYGFFNLACEEETFVDLHESREGQVNGLVGARLRGRLSFVSGLHTGAISLRITWDKQAPAMPSSDWEDVVEASWEAVGTAVTLSAFEDFRDVTLPQTGWHRVRYCVSAMDAGRELDTPDEGVAAPDRYLVQLWPAPTSSDVVVREGSRAAGYWHGVARDVG